MSFHVYVEPELEQKIEAVCKRTGRKRNTIVREALREYIEKLSLQAWPDDVFRFKPDARLSRFESLRDNMPQQRDDIFAGNDS